jgi:hypothetical protein
MSIQVTPIPRLTVLTVPAFTLGTANAAGSADTGVASDSTLLVYDTTLPDAIAYSQSGATGSATTSARRDHSHAIGAGPGLHLVGATDISDVASVTQTGITRSGVLVVLLDITPATDGAELRLQLGDSSGIDTGASDYAWYSTRDKAGDTSLSFANDGADSSIAITDNVGNAAGEACNAMFLLQGSGNGLTMVQGESIYFNGTPTMLSKKFQGRREVALDVTQIRILFSSGNLTDGKVLVYEYLES